MDDDLAIVPVTGAGSDDWEVELDPGQSVVVRVDKGTHQVTYEDETEDTVTVAIRPRAVKGLADAQE